MANLSPAAKAVLDAVMLYEINPECYSREIAAAALEAVSWQCLHERPGPKGRRYILASELRQLAAELKA